MDFEQVLELARCWAFLLMLASLDQYWHNKLLVNSISFFEQLVQLFISRFLSTRQRKKSANLLVIPKQGANESFTTYMQQFNKEAMQVEDFIG